MKRKLEVYMAAAYDSYDYPAYWTGREYEHRSEVVSILELLSRIPKIERFLEIGAGYGRLTPTYLYRAKRILITDPSSRLLSIASKKYKRNKKIKIIQSTIENLTEKIRSSSVDTVLMVRVLHHIKDVDKAFEAVKRMLIPGGYFILEFANKSHGKAVVKEFFKGNFTFLLDIFPKDISSKKSLKNKSLPFINWHPDLVFQKLEDNGFEVLERRSVSNLRHSILKNILSMETIISIEKNLQKPLSMINFGPSVFVLARLRSEAK